MVLHLPYMLISSISRQKLQTFPIHYKIVMPDYCSLVCPDRICLKKNFKCDGKSGCKDESDEKSCTRMVEKNGTQVLVQ